MRHSFIAIMLTLLLILALLIYFNSGKTEFMRVTGATTKQQCLIEYYLNLHYIKYDYITISNNPLTYGMDSNWIAYDLTNNDFTSTYLLILHKNDLAFTAVLYSDGTLIEGFTDSILPALFLLEYK